MAPVSPRQESLYYRVLSPLSILLESILEQFNILSQTKYNENINSLFYLTLYLYTGQEEVLIQALPSMWAFTMSTRTIGIMAD